MKDDPSFEQLIQEAISIPFSGWDFTIMRERWQQNEPAWDYQALAREHISKATRLLDQDTGGGELLASLAPLPSFTYATESYPPNIPVARNRLKPLGVHLVSEFKEDALPFADGYFDLVLNRHGGYTVFELRRILKPGGIFLTQQVGGEITEN
jgi:SAM-dependent methyltransferase